MQLLLSEIPSITLQPHADHILILHDKLLVSKLIFTQLRSKIRLAQSQKMWSESPNSVLCYFSEQKAATSSQSKVSEVTIYLHSNPRWMFLAWYRIRSPPPLLSTGSQCLHQQNKENRNHSPDYQGIYYRNCLLFIRMFQVLVITEEPPVERIIVTAKHIYIP